MANMEDIESLVCACLEDDLIYGQILLSVKNELNCRMRTAKTLVNQYMHQHQSIYSDARAYSSSLYKKEENEN